VRPYVDDEDVLFDPPTVVVPGTTVLLPQRRGVTTFYYEVIGDVECTCRPTPSGAKCANGCPGGSGASAIPTEKVPVYNADHTTVFERLGLAFGYVRDL
jgi:hypothetical protein